MDGSAGQSFDLPIDELVKLCKPVRVVLVPLELQVEDSDYEQIVNSKLKENKYTLSKTKRDKNKKSKTEYVECELNDEERRIIELIEANDFEEYDLANEDSHTPLALTFDPNNLYPQPGTSATTTVYQVEGMEINKKNFYKQCRYCEARFNRQENLKNHELTHNEYESENELGNPRQKMKKPSTFCTQCDATFDGPKTIRKHELFHKEGIKFTCQPCRFGFETRKTFLFHNQTKHTDVEKYVCKFCGIRFKIRRVWSTHLKTHATNQRYLCAQCGSVFTTQYSLNRHLKMHERSEEYACDVCGRSFLTIYACRLHKGRYHRGDKERLSEELICKVCGKSFTRASYLKVHVAIHVGDTPHKCQNCPKRFPNQSSLNRHFQTVHGGESVKVQCDHCGKLFKHKESLAAHVKYQHSAVGEVRVACDMCGKIISKRKLTQHKKSHDQKTLKCNQCSFITNTPHLLKEHSFRHIQEKRYRCTCCPASYRSLVTLKKHMLTHNDNETYDLNSLNQN